MNSHRNYRPWPRFQRNVFFETIRCFFNRFYYFLLSLFSSLSCSIVLHLSVCVCVCACVVCVCAPATREMVQILQEYGGVVCCFGSSASVDNTAVFLQADCRLTLTLISGFTHGEMTRLQLKWISVQNVALSSSLRKMPVHMLGL